MRTSRRFPLPHGPVYANSTTARFFPRTGWMDASEIEEARITFELLDVMENLTVAGAFQTADAENDTDSATALTSYTGTLGVTPGSWTSVTSPLTNKPLVRWGFLVKNSSGETQNMGIVGGVLEIG